jgi:hypothetical protein
MTGINRVITASASAASAANNALRRSSVSSVAGSLQNFPQPPAPGRRISTVSSPTVFDKNGKVTDAGHIQLETSPEEQAKFGLAKVFGQSPDLSKPTISRSTIDSTLQDGTPFKVGSLKKHSLPFNQDKPISPDKPGYKSTYHGELTAEQADKLKNHQASSTYETSGRDGENCVHEYKKVMEEMGLDNDSPIHDHTTPQEMAERTSGAKTGNT